MKIYITVEEIYQERRDVFDKLHQMNGSIFLLQEMHLKVENENFIRSIWGYDLWLSGSHTNKNGVAVLFMNNFEYKLHDVVRDVDGHYIIMDIEFLNKRFTLVNVYAPSSGDDPQFFHNISNLIENIGNENIIIGGDFNCVLCTEKDTCNHTSVVNRPRARRAIKDLMLRHDLTDIWRDINPDKRAYTWRKFNSVKQGRLDYFLISHDLVSCVDGSSFGVSYRSDHTPVILALKKVQFVRDRPLWKFNNSLLKDKEYVEIVKKVISEVKKQYVLPVYNYDNIDEVSPEMLQFQISDQMFFEMILLEIRGKTISYSSYKKKAAAGKRK